MANTRILWDNLWRQGSVIAKSTELPQMPAIYTQDDDSTLCWRSRYGTGTGNGLFIVTTANHHIDFDEGGGELNAVITAGTYNGTTLAAEVKTQMDAAGGTYTVTYSESTGKFTIARGAGNFTLKWATGANTAATAGTLLGFAVAADDTGAATYTGDNARFHYPSEYIDIDQGSALEYDQIVLLNHNASASSTIKVYGADDSAFTTNLVSDTVTYNGNDIRFFLSASRTKRYVRVEIADPTNTSGYVQIGTIALGKYLDLGVGARADNYADGYSDETVIERSPGRNMFITQSRPTLRSKTLGFSQLTEATKASVLQLLAACGHHYALDICLDSSAPNTASIWCCLSEAAVPSYAHYGYWNWDIEVLEHV